MQAASLPFPTTTTPSGSNLSPNVTTVIDKLPQSSADELYTHFPPTTPTGHETTIEIISSLAATPLTTPVLPTSSDGVDGRPVVHMKYTGLVLGNFICAPLASCAI